MNKRQKKKFKTKFHHKTYLGTRRDLIMSTVMKHAKENESYYSLSMNIVHIIDSKKMNLKHPKKVSMFLDCYPTSFSNGSCETGTLDVDFKCVEALDSKTIERVLRWKEVNQEDSIESISVQFDECISADTDLPVDDEGNPVMVNMGLPTWLRTLQEMYPDTFEKFSKITDLEREERGE